jgi:Lrp/AsnC family transcriptional regulator for asnA, asnC and gidA
MESAKLDELDAQIIMLLQENGRQSNAEIARRLGAAEATVRKRIHRLLRNDIIHIEAWADPLKVGYQSYIMLQLRIAASALEKASARLAALPEVIWLAVCTGTCDVFAVALLRSSAHMYEFLTKSLASIPGVMGTETSTFVRIVKREFRYDVLAGRGGEGKRFRPRARRADRTWRARPSRDGRAAGR